MKSVEKGYKLDKINYSNKAIQNSKHPNMYKIILVLLITFLFNTIVHSQTQEELILEIDQLIKNTNLSRKRKKKKALKKLRLITSKERENKIDMAVLNARVGIALSKKGMYDDAREFHENSWDIRGKYDKDVYSQKWPLRALIINGIQRRDLEYALEYSLICIKLMDEKRAELRNEWELKNGKTTEETFLSDLPYFIGAIYDYNQWDGKLVNPTAMELRHHLLTHCMKKYPASQEKLMEIAIPYYIHVVRLQLYTNEDLQAAKIWADRAVDLFKADYLIKDYSQDILPIAYSFTGKDYDHKGQGVQPGYIEAGIAIAQQYVDEKYDLEAYDDVLYGTRYMATQYGELRQYDTAFQYLADAIKICKKYDLEEKIVKSIGGMHVMLGKIRRSRDKSTWEKVQQWKDGYDLKGLSDDEIKRIDRIISDYPVR